MSDYTELKALAEAATAGRWTTDGDCDVMSADSDQLNMGYLIGQCHGPDSRKNAQYIAAANPAAVLALIAEVERLTAENEFARSCMQSMIDQTTPLVPVEGDPMWSRRIELDEVIAERDQLHAAHQLELESHRKTFTQLEQAKREIAQLKGVSE